MGQWADVLGPHLVQVEPRDARGLSSRSRLVDDAHGAGLAVVPYTVRPENTFLPAELRSGDGRDLAARGDVAALLRQLRDDGVDGVFTDDPATALAAYA